MNSLLGTICLSAIFAGILSEVSAEVSAKPRDHTIRIINGTTAADGEFPYLVQFIDNSNKFFCGGSIIGSRWILTAGHCVEDGVGGKVAYGTNVLAEGKPVNKTVKIKQRYLHPQFAYYFTRLGRVPYFDVGIFELEHDIPFDAKAQPVKLANASAQVPFHQNSTLAGWGYNATDGDVMEYLQKTNLQLLNDTECAQKLYDYVGEKVFASKHNICSDDHWTAPCSGDSGSPLVIDGLQYGIVSWSYKPCGVTPAAYSRLTTPVYREFIKNVTGI